MKNHMSKQDVVLPMGIYVPLARLVDMLLSEEDKLQQASRACHGR